jgi:hypothetical protein
MKLIYCNKKSSNSGSCSSLATHKCELQFNHETKTVYRCDKHKFSGTVHGKVNQNTVEVIDQQKELNEVNVFLKSLIGTKFTSKFHRGVLEGKYIKENGGIMCLSHNNKWKFVYHHQIILG